MNTPVLTSADDQRTSDIDAGAHRPGIPHHEMVQKYDEWADNYDKDLGSRYRGPEYAVNTLVRYLAAATRPRILDVGAGTGLVGQLLRKQGFLNVDALEPSDGMIRKAKEKGVYSNFICDKITDNQLDIKEGSYDVIIMSGAMGEGHLPIVAFREMIRILKPGGLLVNATRLAYLSCDIYRGKVEPYFKELEELGLWTRLERTILPNYSWNNDGVVYVYRRN